MKTNNKPFLKMDERNKMIALKIIAIMYFLTIFAIQGIVLYRQFGLGQEINDFEDIAIIMTVNSLFLISALLYYGAIPIQKLKTLHILMIFIGFVILGSAFTYFKYNIFQSPGLTLDQLMDKLIIVVSVLGIIMGFWIVMSLLGKRRLEKELEES